MTRQRANRHSGFSLLIAVVLIGAIGLTLGLLSRHFVGLTVSVTYVTLDARAAQLLADGQAWAAAHREQCSALLPGGVIDLPVANLGPPSLTATLRIAREQPGVSDVSSGDAAREAPPPQLVIRAIVRQENYASTASAVYALPPQE